MKKYGMKLSDLDRNVLVDIFAIYDEVAHSAYAREHVKTGAEGDLEYIDEMLSCGNAVEWRFGSSFSQDTKLFIWKAGYNNDDEIIRFSFDSNPGVSDPQGLRQEEAKLLEKTFKDRVEQYLVGKGLATPLHQTNP